MKLFSSAWLIYRANVLTGHIWNAGTPQSRKVHVKMGHAAAHTGSESDSRRIFQRLSSSSFWVVLKLTFDLKCVKFSRSVVRNVRMWASGPHDERQACLEGLLRRLHPSTRRANKPSASAHLLGVLSGGGWGASPTGSWSGSGSGTCQVSQEALEPVLEMSLDV